MNMTQQKEQHDREAKIQARKHRGELPPYLKRFKKEAEQDRLDT